MLYNDLVQPEGLYLAHHGVKGQRWGVRRYQNEDGSLTKAGRKRFGRYGSSVINEIETEKRRSGLSYDKIGRQILNDRIQREMKGGSTPRKLASVGVAALGLVPPAVLGATLGGTALMTAPAFIFGAAMVSALVNMGITSTRVQALSDVGTAYEIPNLTIQKSHHND
jgi:hypothetical protein